MLKEGLRVESSRPPLGTGLGPAPHTVMLSVLVSWLGVRHQISSDETSEEAEISSDETSEAAEPVPKRSRPRKSVAAHHRKTGISQTWTKEFKWLQKVRVNNKVGLVCKICHRHAAVPRSGSKVWTSKPCFHLRLDKIKQHAKSNMHKLSMLAEADTTVAIS